MEKDNKLPKRKRLRLKEFDYSTSGAYYITICTHNRKKTLSSIVRAIHESPAIELTKCGKIVERFINEIPDRFNAKIDKYIIRPNHIEYL